MADFLTAFTAMWNNEGEIWGRKIGLKLWLFRVQNKAIQVKTMGEREWVKKDLDLDSYDLQATDWHKVDLTKKEVPWWEAWEWGKANPDKTFWVDCESKEGERQSAQFCYAQNDASVHNLIDGKGEARWFIPADAEGEVAK